MSIWVGIPFGNQQSMGQTICPRIFEAFKTGFLYGVDSMGE
jgi:hypothetical protein